MFVSHILSVVHTLTSLSNQRIQITAQDKHNVDLFGFNASLWKANIKLVEEKKGLFAKVVELKSKIKELDDNHADLVRQNAKLIAELDAGRDELAKEKAKNTNLEAESGVVQKKLNSLQSMPFCMLGQSWWANSREESMLIGIRIRRFRPRKRGRPC